jgi:hypothetical protein
LIVHDPHDEDGNPKYDPDRPRQWMAHFLGGPGNNPVILRRYAILADGEDLTEDPPSVELNWGEWVNRHGEYGLDVDGQPAQ